MGAAIGSRRPPLIWLPAAVFAVLLLCGLGVLAAARSGAPPEPIITHSASRAALPAAADAPTRVDLNYAARAELEALPAIGPAAAAAIIERRAIAPIGSLRELVELGILRASQLPALADLVMLSVRRAAP